MAALTAWIPMRWLAGPLDIGQREKEKGFTAKSKEVLQRWLDPSVLEILRGTPVNCLVVNWAAGLPADAEQQKALAPLLAQGKTAGLSFVGLVEGEANQTAAVASARAAGLEAVIVEGEVPNAGLPVIPLAARPHLPWNSSSPVLVAKGNVWPGIANQGLNSQDWRHEDERRRPGPLSDPGSIPTAGSFGWRKCAPPPKSPGCCSTPRDPLMWSCRTPTCARLRTRGPSAGTGLCLSTMLCGRVSPRKSRRPWRHGSRSPARWPSLRNTGSGRPIPRWAWWGSSRIFPATMR